MTGEVFFDFTLDFGNVSTPKRLRLTQYSDRLPILRAKLYNVGAAYTIPDGATVNVRWKKPSGTVVYNPVTSATGNVITYALDGQCASAAGTCSVCFEITTGGNTMQTPVFPVEVVANPVQDGDIEDSPQLDALDKAIAEASEQAKQMFEDAVEGAKDEADRLISESSGFADAAAESAAEAADSARRSEEAAERAESFAPVDGQVLSVNGKGGVVVIDAYDVGALPAPESETVSAGMLLAVKEVTADGKIITEAVDRSIFEVGFIETEEDIPAEERVQHTLYGRIVADLSPVAIATFNN